MRITPPKNANYAAVVVEVKNLIPLEGCDNVVGTNFFGFQAIISKDTPIGTIGIVFPAETQLAVEYASENNLFRHNDQNKDQAKKGYIEDNCRVKAVKFRGHTSSCLFMPLESFSYLGVGAGDFQLGMEFDEINGKEICRKYVIPTRGNGMHNPQHISKKESRVDRVFFPEHFDTENYWKNCHKVPEDTEVVVTQKIHGTSIIIGHTTVKRKKTIRDRIAAFFGVPVQETELDYVFGSRRVVKDVNNKDHDHFYDVDLWSIEGKKLEGLVPENFIVYGELIGWVPTGAPIQKGYTYKLPQGLCKLYVYRVTFVNARGFVVDLTWDQVKEFCEQRGLNHVPEMWRGKHKDFIVDQYIDQRYFEEYANCLPLDDEDKVDEGVCIRVDKITPYILKAKSPKFFEWETAQLDEGEIDLESAESNVDNNKQSDESNT